MTSLSGLGKRSQGILRNQSTRGFFGFESSFQNCYWNILSTSSLSQICKIRNAWKLPVSSQGILRSHVLKKLLGVSKHHFGRKFIQEKSVPSMGSEYCLRRDWKLPGISYFTDLRQTRCSQKIPKTVLRTRLKTKETTYTLVLGKYLVVSFPSHLKSKYIDEVVFGFKPNLV
jgi:hypothetical protein